MPPIIAVANLKGGVGKSTLVANLGASFWSDEKKPERVLLIDLDYQASLSKSCLKPQELEDAYRQGRTIDTLFTQDMPDPDFVSRNASRIGNTRGSILPAAFELQRAESLAQARWLIDKHPCDVRYLLRQILHTPKVQADFDIILLDCPPRLTTACINALTCCDHVLIPVLPDQTSAEAVPRLLSSLRELKPRLFPQLSVLGMVANKKSGARGEFLMREKEIWENLKPDCRDAWQETVYQFSTVIRAFTEAAKQRPFPALHPDLRVMFQKLANETRQQLAKPYGVPS
jgi:chromosome partitioning protein